MKYLSVNKSCTPNGSPFSTVSIAILAHQAERRAPGYALDGYRTWDRTCITLLILPSPHMQPRRPNWWLVLFKYFSQWIHATLPRVRDGDHFLSGASAAGVVAAMIHHRKVTRLSCSYVRYQSASFSLLHAILARQLSTKSLSRVQQQCEANNSSVNEVQHGNVCCRSMACKGSNFQPQWRSDRP